MVVVTIKCSVVCMHAPRAYVTGYDSLGPSTVSEVTDRLIRNPNSLLSDEQNPILRKQYQILILRTFWGTLTHVVCGGRICATGIHKRIWGSGDIPPLILNFCSKWKWLASCTPRQQ
jgi:hypothetical protein